MTKKQLSREKPWQVVSYLPNTLKVLVRVAAVCTSWRQAVLEADPVRGGTRSLLLTPWEAAHHLSG